MQKQSQKYTQHKAEKKKTQTTRQNKKKMN